MKDHARKSAAKWNLMLLAGRPLAFAGLLLIFQGLALANELSMTRTLTGGFLVPVGFACAWTGKIGKALFYE